MLAAREVIPNVSKTHFYTSYLRKSGETRVNMAIYVHDKLNDALIRKDVFEDRRALKIKKDEEPKELKQEKKLDGYLDDGSSIQTINAKMNDEERRVYDFICRFIVDKNMPPLQLEIESGVGIGQYDARKLVQAIARKGFISFVKNSPRSIRVIKTAEDYGF